MKSPKNILETTRRFRRTPKGVLTNIYHKQIERSRLRGYVLPDYSLVELHDRFLADQKFLRLFNEWVRGKYSKHLKPSIDRINHNKPYTTQNIQIMTWGENRFKETMERRCRKGAVLQSKDGELVARYRSQREATKLTGLHQGNLSSALNGKRKKVSGYTWEYENPELLEEGK